MRALAVAFGLILTSVAALAQIGIPFPGPGTAHTTVAAYQGPGDIVPGAVGLWGLRAMTLTWADGTHIAIRVTRNDSEVCDVLLNTTGDLGNTVAGSGAACAHAATAIATWCGASPPCAINTYYDQSGNGRNVPAVALKEQGLSFSPTQAHSFPGASDGYCTSGTVSLGQIVSVSTVVNQNTPNATNFETYVAFDTGPSQVGGEKSGTPNKGFMYGGTAVVDFAATSGAYHATQAIFNGASSRVYIDGTDINPVASNPGTGSASAAIICLNGKDTSAGNNCDDCFTREWGIWPNAAAATFAANLAAINSNQHTYWSF